MESNVALFVYGTLIHKKTLANVLGRTDRLPVYISARLDGFKKDGLNIIEDPKSWVQGYVIEVTPDDIDRLDKYERVSDGLYHKILVYPEFGAMKGKSPCIAYQLLN